VRRHRWRLILWLSVGALVVLLVALVLLYQGLRSVPTGYRQAMQLDRPTLRKGSDQALRRASALASDIQRDGPWEAWFTDEQINGWLAVDLPENHPRALPEGVRDPRVQITSDHVALFCTVERAGQTTVLTLLVEPYLSEPDVVALRLRGARAGALPLPIGQATEQISAAARAAELRLVWQQAEGDPVALIHLPEPSEEDGRRATIERLELGEGQIYLAGTTEKRTDESK